MTVHQPFRRPDESTAARVLLAGEYVSNASRIIDVLLGATSAPVVAGDLAATTFMDSTSVRALLEVQGRLADDGRELRLENPTPVVHTL